MPKQVTADIGSYESDEKGSAARACGGKTAWAFMPLCQIAMTMEALKTSQKEPVQLSELTNSLGWFQARGQYSDALRILVTGFRYLMQELDTDFNGACEAVIRVWEFGAQKYERHNWMKGLPWSQVLESAQRHVMWMHQGQALDDETNEHHGAHFLCNAMMLVHYVDYYPEGNDLPVKWFTQ